MQEQTECSIKKNSFTTLNLFAISCTGYFKFESPLLLSNSNLESNIIIYIAVLTFEKFRLPTSGDIRNNTKF